ncbi:MAG TPA: ferritin family protein [Candidatus Nanoarchaeia archaeon]|nr:ferritin family protein [Candidatus Nanoarchaeia archaeon]
MERDYLKDELKALKLAVENEKKVRGFYLKSAAKMKNELAKKTFIFLADEELKHIDAINAFNKSIHEGEEPVIDSGTEDEAINDVKEFFSDAVKNAVEKAIAGQSDLESYEAGLTLEQKGYDFYKKNAAKAEHLNVKKLFEFLMKEENSHYALISNAINYFKKPEEYFQDEESWFFEG